MESSKCTASLIRFYGISTFVGYLMQIQYYIYSGTLTYENPIIRKIQNTKRASK